MWLFLIMTSLKVMWSCRIHRFQMAKKLISHEHELKQIWLKIFIERKTCKYKKRHSATMVCCTFLMITMSAILTYRQLCICVSIVSLGFEQVWRPTYRLWRRFTEFTRKCWWQIKEKDKVILLVLLIFLLFKEHLQPSYFVFEYKNEQARNIVCTYQ